MATCEACGEERNDMDGHRDVPVDDVLAWVCNPCFEIRERLSVLRARIRARRAAKEPAVLSVVKSAIRRAAKEPVVLSAEGKPVKVGDVLVTQYGPNAGWRVTDINADGTVDVTSIMTGTSFDHQLTEGLRHKPLPAAGEAREAQGG